MLADTKPLFYPDSDGEPMADNTKQFDWIATIKGELDSIFADRTDVFIAGDLLWYPVEGEPETRIAPDAMVVFGRPKGYRGSYKQWMEDNIAPQVVFEVLSHGNRMSEMAKKLQRYDAYGVQEYYVIDPDRHDVAGYIRSGSGSTLESIAAINGWTSPLLGISFVIEDEEITIYRPDKRPFMYFREIERLRSEAVAMADEERENAHRERENARRERLRAEQEQRRAQQEQRRAEQEQQRANALAAKLRELGINPDDLV
jgi:Uma2 family endonuclease